MNRTDYVDMHATETVHKLSDDFHQVPTQWAGTHTKKKPSTKQEVKPLVVCMRYGTFSGFDLRGKPPPSC